MPQAIGYALLQAAVSFAISKAVDHFQSPQLRKKWEREEQNRPRVDVEYSGATEPRRRLYGYFRAAGLNVMPAITTGLYGQVLNKMYAMSDGRIEAFDAVLFNNERIEFSDIAETSTGEITTGKYDGWAKVKAYLGDPSQSADSLAMGVQGWSADHRGDGIAYVYFQFLLNLEVFDGGAPDVLLEGRGHRCYDPRLDSSPGDDPTDTAFHVFTTNPALILADYLIWESGANELAANLDWDDVVAAADVCDESVTIPVIPSGTTTQERYTCSYEVYSPLTSQDRDDTITMLARAMMGSCWFTCGKWRMVAGKYDTPVGSIAEEDLLGDFRSTTAFTFSEAGTFNTVRGSYTDQSEATQIKSFPEVSVPAYVSEDGEKVYSDLSWPTARNQYEAQRNAIQAMHLSRRNKSFSGNFRYRTRKFELNDIVTVTNAKMGWTDQPARITFFKERQDWTVDLTLRAVGESDYADPDPSDYTNSSQIPAPVNADYAPEAPQDLAASSQASAIIFEWDPPVNAPVGVLYRLYEHSSPTPFSSAVQVAPDTPQTSIVIPRTSTTLAYFWVTAVDPVTGAESTQSPAVNGVPAAAATASSALSAIAYPSSLSETVYAATATTDSTTATPAGGTAPYTYAWAWHSGGTGITIDSNTAASTTFSATGLAEGDVRSGTAQCTVTDNVAATYVVYVGVTITRDYGVTLNAASYSASGSAGGGPGGGTPAVCVLVVAPDGFVYPTTTPVTPPYQWKNPSAPASDYECQIVVTSGALSSNNASSYLNCASAAQAVGVRTPGEGPGTSSQTLTVRIRDASTLSVLASVTVNLSEIIS